MKTLVAVLALGTAPMVAQDAVTALGRAEQAYERLETLRAEFTQTIVNPMLGGPEITHGTLFLAPPSRFAMKFSDPEGDRIVADGTWLWAYAPSTVPGQVIRQPIPKAGAASPNLLAQFVVRPLEHYRATYLTSDNVNGTAVDVVQLIPRRDDAPFRRAEIAIARESGLVMRLGVRELSGQRRTLVFTGIVTDVPIPDSELTFSAPDGVRIVTP